MRMIEHFRKEKGYGITILEDDQMYWINTDEKLNPIKSKHTWFEDYTFFSLNEEQQKEALKLIKENRVKIILGGE